MTNTPFPHLHLHDEHSYLDSPLKLADLLDFAERKELKYLVTTNHGNCNDAIKLTQGCLERGIFPIIGAELYVIHDGRDKERNERRHLVVLVKTGVGFKNLMSLLTEGALNHFFYKPQIPLSYLYTHLEGLVVLSACSGGILSWSDGVNVCANLLDLQGEDFYLEVMPFEESAFRKYYREVSTVSDKLGVPLVATNDVHYLQPDDWQLHQVLINVQAKKRLKDSKHRTYDVKDLYFKTEKEMRMGFKEQDIFSRQQINSAIENAYRIAESCKFVLQPVQPSLPIVPRIGKQNHIKYFENLCREGLKNRNLKGEEYEERLEFEIVQIKKLKFVEYFLIVWDLQRWTKKEAKILTSPCRGSVGGSLVAYALGITEIDPLKYDLTFQRFIAPGRIDFPDIDLDFEDNRRSEVKDYIRRTYGENYVANVGTFGKMKAKGALRDVSRYYDVPLVEVNMASKNIEQRNSNKLFKSKYPEVIGHAEALEGNLRNLGMHAAGLVLSSEDLRTCGRCYLRKSPEGVIVNWDMQDLQFMGFVKFDLLGLSALSILSEVKRRVGEKNMKGINNAL